MARLKFKDIEKMETKVRLTKLKELKLELAKSKANAAKGGSAKIKEAKKTIARIIMLNKSHVEELKNK